MKDLTLLLTQLAAYSSAATSIEQALQKAVDDCKRSLENAEQQADAARRIAQFGQKR